MTDDKCLVCWNGLMISGLAAANRRDLASVCADALLRWYSESGDLPRFIWRGSPVGEGFLEDYAYLALALFELGGHEVMADSVCSEMVRRFYDEEEGGFFGTAAHGERLFGRTKPVLDQPIPSANSAAIRCLIYAGDEARAAQSLNVFGGWMTRVPMACEALFTTLLFYERTFGKLSARARPTLTLTSAAFEEGVLSGSFDLELPKGWRVNLEDGSPVLTARANSQPLPLTLDQAGRLIHATFRRPLSQAPQEVVVSYQLCTESECLAVAHQALPFKISI